MDKLDPGSANLLSARDAREAAPVRLVRGDRIDPVGERQPGKEQEKKPPHSFFGSFQALALRLFSFHHSRQFSTSVMVSWWQTACIDATTARAKELGAGVSVEPMDVMDIGRMAVLVDPVGAVFALWQAKTRKGTSVCEVPGAPNWYEHMTKDAALPNKIDSNFTPQEKATGTHELTPTCDNLTPQDEAKTNNNHLKFLNISATTQVAYEAGAAASMQQYEVPTPQFHSPDEAAPAGANPTTPQNQQRDTNSQGNTQTEGGTESLYHLQQENIRLSRLISTMRTTHEQELKQAKQRGRKEAREEHRISLGARPFRAPNAFLGPFETSARGEGVLRASESKPCDNQIYTQKTGGLHLIPLSKNGHFLVFSGFLGGDCR